MSVDITIPSVGESVSSGFITQWHKADGEMVNSGDLLLTLDTDKISTEIAAESAGVLEILVPEGQDVEIGAVVGKISSASEHSKSPEISNEKENVSDRTLIEDDKSNNLDEIHGDEPEVLSENINQIVPAKTLIEDIAKRVIEHNPDQVTAYKNGKDKLFGFFVGQIMKETQGKANPKSVNKILKKILN